jgi:membrane-bound serine protease (ClpP class)
MEEKIVNDTVSWARALAEERGRNADWAAQAVRESASITADEAVEKQVVDLKAVDLSDLLEKIHGRTVLVLRGEKKLRTKGARIERVEMWWGERLLALISHPQVAFLLLIFGFYGVLYELYSPGWGIPGTVGLICLLLGLFGLSVLPVNYLGLGLIAVALGLFVAEAFVASYGLLTLAGVVCMILGGLMLIESPTGFIGLTWGVVVAVALATAAIVVLLVGAIVRAHRREVLTGEESWVGRDVQAKTEFVFQDGQYSGKVYLDGEWWQAKSSAPLKPGDTCRILRREGLTLIVEPRQPGDSPAASR